MAFKNSALLAVASISLSIPANAQQQQVPDLAPAVEADIVVTGFANPYRLTGEQLALAQAAFAANRGRLAPQSQLYFQVASQGGDTISDLDLYLKRGDDIISLPLDGQHRFILPPLSGGDWTLFANRNHDGITVTPVILSPGTSERSRLLGDLRLQCEVYWAMSSPEVSIVVRSMFRVAGGCRSTRFGYYITTQAPITAVRVSDGSTSIPLRTWGDHRYQAPIGVKTLPNSARITLDPA
jgi:hypothetical protein